MIDRQRIVEALKTKPVYNDAPWVTITQSGETVRWQCLAIHHLTPDENRGNHHLYVDILDTETGMLIQPTNISIGYTWQGRNADEANWPVLLEKPVEGEPSGNLPLWKGQIVTAWLIGDSIESDRVENLRTDLITNDGDGNSMYHQSYYLLFAKVDRASDMRPPGEHDQPTTQTISDYCATLERRMAAAQAKAEELLDLLSVPIPKNV